MKIFKIIIFIFLFLHFSVEVNAKILRYVDENGIVTYTDDEEKASAYDYDEYDDLGEPSPDKVFFNYDKISGKLFINNTFNSEITVKVHVSSTDYKDTETTEIYPLSLHDDLPISMGY